MGITFI